jgi:hypothetical protein
MPELETPPRRLSGAATRLRPSQPRAQVELKARGAACEHDRRARGGLDSTEHGAILV